ncbi:methyltransferase domain-containing protein [Salinigranum halophilum]|uniref:methyltransferase domain-containing protein n=1 Tax=Salinigranum halophilum TaxID=2565931 RepID=UPI00115CC1C9|nr:methyltransferase domain-containing protein [Salinigranum halophilum]
MPTRDGSGPDHEELLLLWTARRTGVLDALTTAAGTASAVADETGLDRETAARVVRLLDEYGYLHRMGDEYEVTNRALGFLATRDVRSIGATPHALDRLDALSELGSDTTGASPLPPGDRTLRHRLGAHAATPKAVVRAGVTAAIHAAPDAERVVDVRGASGVAAAEFARRGHAVTLVESEAVLDHVGPMLAGQGVETAAASSVTSVPVEDADLALLTAVLQRYPPATNRTLLESTRDALDAGGVVVVLEPLRGDSPAARRVAVERLASGHGDAYTESEIRTWLAEAGFVDVERRDVPETDWQAVVARRERGVD